MKGALLLWCFIVIIFIVLGLGFAYVIQQQQGSLAGFKAIEQKVAGYDALIKKYDAQLNTDSENIKTIQNTLTSNEADRKGLNEKVDTLMRQVEDVKSQLVDVVKSKEAVVVPPVVAVTPAPVADASQASAPAAVELGTIPVAKAGE